MTLIHERDAGVALPGFNATDVWYAPGDPINSTDAFEHATTLEQQAYIANRWLFVGMMIVLLGFVLAQLPYTIKRIQASSFGHGFWLRHATPVEPKHAGGGSPEKGMGPAQIATAAAARSRLRRLRSPLPAYRVPYINLPLSELLLVLLLWAAGLGVAAWCQATFLTDASRSTLVVMCLMSLAAGLGVKFGGIGTWVVHGYTAVNFLHRWTGRLVLVLATLHVVAYLVVFYQDGIAAQEMAKPANYLGAVAYGGLCLTGVASIGFIRRRWWLLFKFGHHLGLLLLLAGLNYHSGDVVPYLLAIWGLIVLNTVLRSITTRLTIATLTPLVSSIGASDGLIRDGNDSTLVTFPALARGFTPGQHVRLRIWSASVMSWKAPFESHPFTIASGEGEPVRLIVKNAGDWTSKLSILARQREEIRCSIEGPYGGPLNFLFPAFRSVLLIVGGSGISFGMGVARGLLRDVTKGKTVCRNLTLVWIVRHRENLEAFLPLLEDLAQLSSGLEAIEPDFQFSLLLYATAAVAKVKGEDIAGPPPIVAPGSEKLLEGGENRLDPLASLAAGPFVRLHSGRPDLARTLADVISATPGGGIGVGACGPGVMVDDIERLVRGVSPQERERVDGVEMHAERFSL